MTLITHLLPTPETWLLSTILAVALAWFYIQRKKRLTLLERNGIQGPRPSFFTGNWHQLQAVPNVVFDSQLIKRFGQNVGYYMGAKPVILTSCPHVLQIMQKDKNTKALFNNRPRKVPGGINPNPSRSLMLGNLPREEWQYMRKIVEKGFSGNILRSMLEPVKSEVAKLISILGANTEEHDFLRRFQLHILAIIGKVVMGVDSDMQTRADDHLLQAVQAEFNKNMKGWLTKLYLCLPELTRPLSFIRCLFSKHCESPLFRLGYAALEKSSGTSAESPSTFVEHLMRFSGLSKQQIVANAVLMFEAGYETTSSNLAFTVHLLAYHTNLQKKLRKEIRKQRRKYPDDDMEFLHSLKLLHACVLEALRMFPPQTTFINRSADRDVQVSPSMTIPKDVQVQAGLIQLHSDPAVWSSPQKFMPGRFLGENRHVQRECKYQAFGQGSRACVGKELAMIMVKYTLAEILVKFKIVPSKNTEKKGRVKIEYKTATMTPKLGSFARLIPV